MNWRDVIVGGLWLPFEMYLQPTAFKARVAALAPELPENYNLWQARHKLKEADFRRGLSLLLAQSVIALLWVFPLTWLTVQTLAALGYPVDWFRVALSVAVGVAGGVAYGVAVGVAVGVVLGVAVGVALGVAGGVALGVAYGMASGMAVVAPLGVAGGVALGVALGVVGGVRGSITVDIAFGAAFGMAVGVAFGVAAVLTITHLPLLVLQAPLTLGLWAVARAAPGAGRRLWRLCPPRWDEVILLPLPGLEEFLMALVHTDSALGREALLAVAAHRYQNGAAYRAWSRLAQEEGLRVSTLPALAAFQHELAWLTDEVKLAAATRSALAGMRDVSREAASAQASESAANRVRRLEAAAALVARLRERPAEFGPALAQWESLIARALEAAYVRLQEEEPIPQVYVTDGRPVRPSRGERLPLPFRGRESLFARLEAALGGGDTERETLLLYGQRRTGKTSALLHLPERLGSRVAPAFLDLQSPNLGGAEDVAGLWRGVAEGVVEETRRHRGLHLPALDPGALAKEPYPAFGRWLDQVERALGDYALLLCLDEFEALEKGIADGRFDGRLLDTLRNIVQHHRRIAVLLSGSHHIDELPPRWASALVTTGTLFISFLEEADTRRLIREPVPDFPDLYTEEAVARIVHLTHCQPYLVQLTCGELVRMMNAAGRLPPASQVGAADVEAVIPTVLERGQSYFVDLWSNQAGGEPAQRLLLALARAPERRLARAALPALLPDEFALQAAVRSLTRREIITADGDDYTITVPLVGEYVRREYLPAK